jgi:hypothetical protein
MTFKFASIPLNTGHFVHSNHGRTLNVGRDSAFETELFQLNIV